MNLHHLLGGVERVESLDASAAATSRVAGRLIDRSGLAGPLRGSWLGHPVHPLLITLPIGTWMTSAVFDVVFKDVTAARRLVAVGLAATPPTVLAGWADYALLNRRQQRVGLVHAASNALGVTMFALSYRAYRRHRNRAARTYTFLGLAAISVGGALGSFFMPSDSSLTHGSQCAVVSSPARPESGVRTAGCRVAVLLIAGSQVFWSSEVLIPQDCIRKHLVRFFGSPEAPRR
jgi:uncharacterized membrane protein